MAAYRAGRGRPATDERRRLRAPPQALAAGAEGARPAPRRRQQLLLTTLGTLDVLGAIEVGRGHETLLPDTVTIEVEGQPVRVVRLETLADLERGGTASRLAKLQPG